MKNPNPPAAKDTDMRRKGLTYLIMTLVFVAVSVLSLMFVSRIFGGGAVLLSFRFLTLPVLLGLCVLLLVYFVFDSLRFYFILRTLDVRIPFLYIVKLSFINVFVSAVTPLATGGGFAQLYFLARRKVPLGSATAASTIRTLLAVAFFMLAAPVVLIWNPSLLGIIGTGYAVILIITVVVYVIVVSLIFWVVGNERRMKRATIRLTRRLRNWRILSPLRARRICLRTFAEVRNFNIGVKLFLRGRKRFVLLSVLFTVLFLFTLFSFPVVLTAAMETRISPVWIYQSQIIITFVMYFAFTPGASGIAEGGFALLFAKMVGENDITSLTLLWRFFTVYLGTIIGIILFYFEMVVLSRGKGRVFAQDEEASNAS